MRAIPARRRAIPSGRGYWQESSRCPRPGELEYIGRYRIGVPTIITGVRRIQKTEHGAFGRAQTLQNRVGTANDVRKIDQVSTVHVIDAAAKRVENSWIRRIIDVTCCCSHCSDVDRVFADGTVAAGDASRSLDQTALSVVEQQQKTVVVDGHGMLPDWR